MHRRQRLDMSDDVLPTGAAIRKAERAARKDARVKSAERIKGAVVHEENHVAIAQPARTAIERTRPTRRGQGQTHRKEVG